MISRRQLAHDRQRAGYQQQNHQNAAAPTQSLTRYLRCRWQRAHQPERRRKDDKRHDPRLHQRDAVADTRMAPLSRDTAVRLIRPVQAVEAIGLWSRCGAALCKLVEDHHRCICMIRSIGIMLWFGSTGARYRTGLDPWRCRKRRAKWLGSAKPQAYRI